MFVAATFVMMPSPDLDPFGPEAYHLFEVTPAEERKSVVAGYPLSDVIFRPAVQRAGSA